MRIKEMNLKIPVIIVTAHGTEKDRRECLALGAYAFMHKPVGLEALMTILARIEETSA
jgi:DNA-binding NtrC family response regulator